MNHSVLIFLVIIAVAKSQVYNGRLAGPTLSPFAAQQTFAPRTALSQMLGQTNQGLLENGGVGMGGIATRGFQNPLAGGSMLGQSQGLFAQNQGQGLFNQRQGLLNQRQGLFGQGQNLLNQVQGQGLFGTNGMLRGQANNMFGTSPNNFLGQSTTMLGQRSGGVLGFGNAGNGLQNGFNGQTGLTNNFGSQALLPQTGGGMFGQNALSQGLSSVPMSTGFGSANSAQSSLNDPLVMSMLLGGDSSDALLLSSMSGAGVGAGLGGMGSCSCPRNYAPVCTMTGETYNNGCLARCSGRIVACQNMCPC